MNDIQGNTEFSTSPAIGWVICVAFVRVMQMEGFSISASPWAFNRLSLRPLFTDIVFEATQTGGSEAEIRCNKLHRLQPGSLGFLRRLGRLNPQVSFLHAQFSIVVKATQNGGSMGEIISNDLCRLLLMQTLSGSFCVALSSRVPLIPLVPKYTGSDTPNRMNCVALFHWGSLEEFLRRLDPAPTLTRIFYVVFTTSTTR